MLGALMQKTKEAAQMIELSAKPVTRHYYADTMTSALIRSDGYRYLATTRWLMLAAAYYTTPGFRFLVWFRIMQAFRRGGRDKRGWFRNLLFRLVQIKARRLGYRFGFDIPVSVKLGRGTKLGHFGGVVMQAEVELGENCLVSHNVTIGRVPRGKRKGSPVIGDRVYIGTGSVIAGGIKVGSDVLIGPNSFVNFDVPDGSVIVSPGKIVSQAGTAGYIRFLWQEAA
jgi:serine O-acetyltransferase